VAGGPPAKEHRFPLDTHQKLEVNDLGGLSQRPDPSWAKSQDERWKIGIPKNAKNERGDEEGT